MCIENQMQENDKISTTPEKVKRGDELITQMFDEMEKHGFIDSPNPMQTEIKEPLYKRLNKEIEILRFEISSTPHEDRNKGIRFKVNVNEHERLSKQYKDLATDNLHHLAEALERFLLFVDQQKLEYESAMVRQAKEALQKIS